MRKRDVLSYQHVMNLISVKSNYPPPLMGRQGRGFPLSKERENMKRLQRSPEQQREYMLETPIPKLISTLAVPTVLSMLITSLYNMADTYFVSQINTSASGAVGVVFSIMTIIQAVGFTVGMGTGSIAAQLMGR